MKRLEAAGADLITVHASGASAMLEAAAAASARARILAVTVLTSLGESDSLEIFGRKPSEAVCDFAALVQQAGVPETHCALKNCTLFFTLIFRLKIIWFCQQPHVKMNSPKQLSSLIKLILIVQYLQK